MTERGRNRDDEVREKGQLDEHLSVPTGVRGGQGGTMKAVWLKVIPFQKDLVTLGLESGVDGFVVESKTDAEAVLSLGRTTVLTLAEIYLVSIASKDDEKRAIALLKSQKLPVFLSEGWEVIPVENIIASAPDLAFGLECRSLERARLAAGIMECGSDRVLITPEAAADVKTIVSELKLSQGTIGLVPATITKIEQVGMGHRVCVDTTSILQSGSGLLVGNSSAFTFLVNAETEANPYVAARPFRVNAGAVHLYVQMPGDKTSYLQELTPGAHVLVVSHTCASTCAIVGRVKTEVRPMLLITAEVEVEEEERGGEGRREKANDKKEGKGKEVGESKKEEGKGRETDDLREKGEKKIKRETLTGRVFLQNAETIRLVKPGGEPVSVVCLREGDKVLVHTDKAGRHFGMRINEDIRES